MISLKLHLQFRTIGEIVEEDIGIDGVYLGLNKSLLEKENFKLNSILSASSRDLRNLNVNAPLVGNLDIRTAARPVAEIN